MARVLIGNISPEIEETLQSLLKKGLHEAVYLHSDDEVIGALQQGSFDLVILDLLDSQKSLNDIIEEVKRMDEFLPILLVTGIPQNPSVLSTKYPRANVFVAIPPCLEDLRFLIQKALSYRQLQMSYKNIKEWIREYDTDKHNIFQYPSDDLIITFQIAKEISIRLEREELYRQIIARTTKVLDVEMGVFLLFNEVKEELVVMAAKGLNQEQIKATRLKPQEAISGHVMQTKEMLFIEDIDQDARFQNRAQEHYYKGALISTPLLWGDQVIGIINVSHKRNQQSFNQQDLDVLKGLAVEAVMMIQLTDFYLTLEELYLKMVLMLNSVIEQKDYYTKEHSQKTQYYAETIAQEMGLSEKEINEIRQACQLQDIGNIRIPDYILTKAGTLTPEEWDTMKSHINRAVDILKPLPFLDSARNIISQHHERYDGKGYPRCLHGDEISVGARIMRVADSVAAMMTERPYRQVLLKEEAISELQKNRGIQFDAEVVDSFLRVVDKSPEILN